MAAQEEEDVVDLSLCKRERVRQSLRRVDLLGVQMRLLMALQSRKYNVPSPNAL